MTTKIRVLAMVLTNHGADDEEIANLLRDVTPVEVSEFLRELEAEGRIKRIHDSQQQ
jgi:hypothetical protein